MPGKGLTAMLDEGFTFVEVVSLIGLRETYPFAEWTDDGRQFNYLRWLRWRVRSGEVTDG